MSKTQIGRLDSIQGMRGIAVILVLLFHFNNNLFYIGHVGVDIFLVISGYAQRYLDNTKVLGEAFGLQSITAMTKPIDLLKLEDFLSAT